MKFDVKNHSASRALPLIIAGPQRSGTRFITNVLNQIAGVTIHGEIPDSIFQHVISLVEKCNHVYIDRGREKWAAGWEITKRDFMFSVWSNLAKGQRTPDDSVVRYCGYKTPFHEEYFDFYNRFFDPVRPKYICCIRSFVDHCLSVQARFPDRSIMFISRRYAKSLRKIQHMKQQRPDDVILFFLDDYKEVGIEYLRKNVFMPLGLDEVSAAERKARKGAVNTSKRLGLKKKKDLNSLQKLFLMFYPGPLKEYKMLHREYGLSE